MNSLAKTLLASLVIGLVGCSSDSDSPAPEQPPVDGIPPIDGTPPCSEDCGGEEKPPVDSDKPVLPPVELPIEVVPENPVEHCSLGNFYSEDWHIYGEILMLASNYCSNLSAVVKDTIRGELTLLQAHYEKDEGERYIYMFDNPSSTNLKGLVSHYTAGTCDKDTGEGEGYVYTSATLYNSNDYDDYIRLNVTKNTYDSWCYIIDTEYSYPYFYKDTAEYEQFMKAIDRDTHLPYVEEAFLFANEI
ncbi:hypothetical protein GT360_00295 [Vibrio astriarenae]|uniref:Uncharacterized protein n=1 Tax=Vibrio astriarenae TaxID=1481923 RepID=A0A7Z2YCH9_9VIBR|nr:hypothetical protein [Vibrio astriarenae]QIA62089.1 hypothetical protein GT360_00295 [Vibrio astriarenae]